MNRRLQRLFSHLKAAFTRSGITPAPYSFKDLSTFLAHSIRVNVWPSASRSVPHHTQPAELAGTTDSGHSTACLAPLTFPEPQDANSCQSRVAWCCFAHERIG